MSLTTFLIYFIDNFKWIFECKCKTDSILITDILCATKLGQMAPQRLTQERTGQETARNECNNGLQFNIHFGPCCYTTKFPRPCPYRLDEDPNLNRNHPKVMFVYNFVRCMTVARKELLTHTTTIMFYPTSSTLAATRITGTSWMPKILQW